MKTQTIIRVDEVNEDLTILKLLVLYNLQIEVL